MATTRKVLLEPGQWFAGYHAPFFITDSMIQPTLEKYGLKAITWKDRDDPLPANLNPKADPKYSDDWDSWVTAVYDGAAKTVEIPHYDHVDWLVRTPAAVPKPTPTAPSGGSDGAAGWVLLALALVASFRGR